jgi:hypothetical protein
MAPPQKLEGKPEMTFIDPDAELSLAKVLTMGAKKHSPEGWREATDDNLFLNALMRHVNAIRRGEIFDPESGEPHATHVQANAMFLAGLALERERRRQADMQHLGD